MVTAFTSLEASGTMFGRYLPAFPSISGGSDRCVEIGQSGGKISRKLDEASQLSVSQVPGNLYRGMGGRLLRGLTRQHNEARGSPDPAFPGVSKLLYSNVK